MIPFMRWELQHEHASRVCFLQSLLYAKGICVCVCVRVRVCVCVCVYVHEL